MQTQNLHFFKGNKSHSPSDICLYQLPTPHPLPPPSFSSSAFQPLSINFQTLKQQLYTSSSHQQRQQSQKAPQNSQAKPLSHEHFQNLIRENQQFKLQLTKIKATLDEQKHKYNQLKNLYKEGQAMFEMMQEKKIFLEKENKQIKTILENVLKELHDKNQHLESAKMPENPFSVQQKKIQKVKIGNKQIPVIKVNVPPETFAKKQHSTSVFSINFEQQNIQSIKSQLVLLKQQNQKLIESNNKLRQQVQKSQRQQKNPQVSANINTSSESLQFYLSNSDKQTSPNPNPNTYSSNYRNSETDISYYKTKYSILETELKKKDQTIKNLYDQCYLLQFQINKLKASPIKTHEFSFKNINENTQNSSNIKAQHQDNETQTVFYKRKIDQLESQINELNKVCIGNVNNSFKINQLNETISKLTKETQFYQQTLSTQQSELRRLYKILENKNLELSEIYSVISETKKSQLFEGSKLLERSNRFEQRFDESKFIEESKLFDGSKRKSFQSMLVTTPQKFQHETRRNGFLETQLTNNFPTQ